MQRIQHGTSSRAALVLAIAKLWNRYNYQLISTKNLCPGESGAAQSETLPLRVAMAAACPRLSCSATGRMLWFIFSVVKIRQWTGSFTTAVCGLVYAVEGLPLSPQGSGRTAYVLNAKIETDYDDALVILQNGCSIS